MSRLVKWYHFTIGTIPLLAAIGTTLMWIDTRYMHRDISDTRFIELQIKIVEGHIRDYHRVIESGGSLSVEDQMKFDLDKDQLLKLRAERDRILGIGQLPE